MSPYQYRCIDESIFLPFLEKYVFSLILDGQVKKAINQIKYSKEANFFEANLLLILDSLTKKKYKQVENRISKLLSYENDDTYQFVILKTLESYNYAFLYKKICKKDGNLGRIDLITQAFQNCYLDSKKTSSHFLNIINFQESDYSRYLFFYLGNIIENEDFNTANKISKTIEPLTSGLLIWLFGPGPLYPYRQSLSTVFQIHFSTHKEFQLYYYLQSQEKKE